MSQEKDMVEKNQVIRAVRKHKMKGTELKTALDVIPIYLEVELLILEEILITMEEEETMIIMEEVILEVIMVAIVAVAVVEVIVVTTMVVTTMVVTTMVATVVEGEDVEEEEGDMVETD